MKWMLFLLLGLSLSAAHGQSYGVLMGCYRSNSEVVTSFFHTQSQPSFYFGMSNAVTTDRRQVRYRTSAESGCQVHGVLLSGGVMTDRSLIPFASIGYILHQYGLPTARVRLIMYENVYVVETGIGFTIER